MKNQNEESDFVASPDDYEGVKAPSRKPKNNPIRTVNQRPGFITKLSIEEIIEEEITQKDGSPGKLITYRCKGPNDDAFDVFTDAGLRNAVKRAGVKPQEKFDLEFLGQKQITLKTGQNAIVNVYVVYEPTW